MIRRFSENLLLTLLTISYWVYSKFWRMEHIRKPARQGSRLWAHWHGDELVLVMEFARRGMAVMSSRSRDGERMKWVLELLGYHVVRGSSSRGGAAGLKGLIDAVRKEGLEASLAVDGPRGPRNVVKPGIVKLAQETGRDLVPGAAAASRKFVFKNSWNQCYVPFPFSRCVVVYGNPVHVPTTATEEEREAIRLKLETTLTLLKAEAENTVAARKLRVLRKVKSAATEIGL